MPKFFTRKGWLTRYALACGYVHRTECAESTVLLELQSSGAPAVTVYERDATGRLNSRGDTLRDGISFFEGFDSVHAARMAYARQTRRLFGSLRRRFESAPDTRHSVIV